MKPKTVIVVGTGPAGLAAAEALLDRAAGAVDVKLMTLGHHLGGKAASWRGAGGRVVEHGQHLVLGFYRELRGLLRRSGVRPQDTMVSSGGEYQYWEDRDETAHRLYVGDFLPKLMDRWVRYSGFTHQEKADLTAFVIDMVLSLGPPVSEDLDDVCFSAWALSRGLPPSVAATNIFRANREVQLNWPGEISAYAMLNTLRAATRNPGRHLTAYPAGGMSELWWEPIAQRIEGLGGSLTRRQKLVRIDTSATDLKGLVFAHPQFHGVGKRWRGSVPTTPGTEQRHEPDAVIVAIPPPCVEEALSPEALRLAGLSGIPKLTTVAPLGLHVWHRRRSRATPGVVVGGLAPPLPYVMDNANGYHELRDDPNVGAALHFVGQLALFEGHSDVELLDRALSSIRRVPGYEMMDREGVLDFRVLRHTAPHSRYWNAEPGSVRNKPRPRTPIRGLYLAGDWVRSEFDFPCMETAVRSGQEAADLVLDDLFSLRQRVSA